MSQVNNSTVTQTVTERFTSEEGVAVAQLVDALRYKPEGRGLDSWWDFRDFSLT